MLDVCAVEACSNPANAARGWCSKHYQRWRRYGSPQATPRSVTDGGPLRRLWPKLEVNPTSGCWHWVAALDPGGYGCITYRGVAYKAHRFAYEHIIGAIPEGLHIDHRCRNRACVNPAHLEPVTPLVNTRRGVGHGAEAHCPAGHPYDDQNTYIWTDPKGVSHRRCRVCKRAAWRRWKARQMTRLQFASPPRTLLSQIR